jgi:ribosome-associated protein
MATQKSAQKSSHITRASSHITRDGASAKSTPLDTQGKRDVSKLTKAIIDGLEDVKAQNLVVFDTEHLSSLFERVIVASGTSNRQTKALSMSVREAVSEAGFPKPRTEGEDYGEWIIVDCGAAVVHIMQPAIRQYYHLEDLWGEKPLRLKHAAAGKEIEKQALAAVTKPKKELKKAVAGTKSAQSAPKKGADAKTVAAKAPAKKAVAKTTKAVKVSPQAAAKKAAAKKTASKSAAKPATKAASKVAANSPAKKAPAKKSA